MACFVPHHGAKSGCAQGMASVRQPTRTASATCGATRAARRPRTSDRQPRRRRDRETAHVPDGGVAGSECSPKTVQVQAPESSITPTSPVATLSISNAVPPGTVRRPDAAASTQADGEFPGIIPQTSTIPEEDAVDYSRTSWTGETRRAKGFSRETGQYRLQAVEFDRGNDLLDPPAPEDIALEQDIVTLDTIEDAEEFARGVALGGRVNIESWSGAPSISFELSRHTQMSSNSLTVTLWRSYKSEPVFLVDVHPQVDLSRTAIDFMNRNGPVEFEKKYGTHYVVGYTIGGMFSGFVQFQYDTVDAATRATLGVQTAVLQLEEDGSETASGSARANFEAGVREQTQNERHRASYTAVGWSTEPFNEQGDVLAPEAVHNMDLLLQASEQMDPSNGQFIEALLAPYDDLEDYKKAVEKYEDNERRRNRRPDKLLFLGKESYKVIAQLLNDEMLRLDFLTRSLEDLLSILVSPSDALALKAQELLGRAFCAQENVRDRFSRDSNARDNWVALDHYIDFVEACREDPQCEHDPGESLLPGTGGSELRRTERGRVLANSVFKFETLNVEYEAFLERVKEEFPKLV